VVKGESRGLESALTANEHLYQLCQSLPLIKSLAVSQSDRRHEGV
jgi:hypothetical protein